MAQLLDGFTINGTEYNLLDKVAQSRLDALINTINNPPTEEEIENGAEEVTIPNGAEVVDGRIGWDGTKYGSIGTAIRMQVTNLDTEVKNKLNQFQAEVFFEGKATFNTNPEEYQTGYISSIGKPDTDTSWEVSDLIACKNYNIIKYCVIGSPDVSIITFYNKELEVIQVNVGDPEHTGELQENSVHIPDNACYFRYSFALPPEESEEGGGVLMSRSGGYELPPVTGGDDLDDLDDDLGGVTNTPSDGSLSSYEKQYIAIGYDISQLREKIRLIKELIIPESKYKPFLSYRTLEGRAYDYDTGKTLYGSQFISFVIPTEGVAKLVYCGFKDMEFENSGITIGGCAAFSSTTEFTPDTYIGKGVYVPKTEDTVEVFIPEGAVCIVPYFNSTKDYLIKGIEKVIKADDAEITMSRFYGKRLGVIGDDISSGRYSTRSYPEIVASTLGMILDNKAISQQDLAGIYEQIDNFVDAPDVIFIMGGLHNYKNTDIGGTIGKLFHYPTEDTRIVNEDGSIIGTLNRIISKIQTKFPKALIVLITPPKNEYGINLSNVEGDLYPYDLVDLVQAYQMVSTLHSVPVFDLCSECPINPLNPSHAELYYKHIWESGEKAGSRDLTHPTVEGHEVMAKYIVGKLLTYSYLLE